MGDPQWSTASSDRPQWTPSEEPRSWFEQRPPSRTSPAQDPAEGVPGTGDPWQRPPADDAVGWRAASDLTDTAWGLDGAWRDPWAQWNVSAGAPGTSGDRAGWDRDTAWGADTGWTPQGRVAEDRTPQGRAAEVPAAQGLAAQGLAAQGLAAQGRPAEGWAAEGWTAQGPPAEGRAAEGWAAEGWAARGWAANGGDAGSAGGWAGQGGWNGPTDTAWTAAEPAGSPVALLDRPEDARPEQAESAPAEPERRHAVRHPLRLGLFALVLFGLVAGSVAWLSLDKSVTLTVDGQARAVKTYASTVGGVLDDENITVGEHDTLAPGRDTRISDGAEIVLRRGRLVTLTVDGVTRQVWTTAPTVQEALEQIGYRQDGLWMSESRSTRLPLDGFQLTLRTPKAVTVVADGRKRTIVTTAATVGQALDQAGLDIDADDKVSQLSSAPVRAGMTITVTRVTTKTTTTQAVVEYRTVERIDPDADPGSRTVQTKGVTGLQQVTTVQTYVNGTLTSSKITKRVVVRTPVDEVVVLGPQPEESAPPPEPSQPPQPSQPAECADFPTTGGLNWCGLAKCESGLDPNAYNPAGPYYGLYQFDIGTWQANGGTGTPSGKSIEEQTRVAYNLYQARGAAPWPVCGKNL